MGITEIRNLLSTIPPEALEPVAGQHPTLTAMQKIVGDVPALLDHIEELEDDRPYEPVL